VSPTNKAPVEIEDLYRIKLISDPQASPDGKTVAFVLTRLRKKKDDYASNVWLVPTDGSKPASAFTRSESRDTHPRWSPSGEELAFLSTRSGKAQIWIIPVSGGEARKLTRVKNGVQEFEWSPDGRWIAFTAKVDGPSEGAGMEVPTSQGDTSENREPGTEGSEEGLVLPQHGAEELMDDEEESEDDKKPEPARVVERLRYKADGIGYLEKWTHLFVVAPEGGKPQQITEGEWNATSPRWSPDGKRLAYIANKEEDSEYRNIQDIFVTPIDNEGEAGETTQATGHNISVRGYSWLPDRGFCILGHRRVDEAAYGSNVEVYRLEEGGDAQHLTEGWDRSAATDLLNDLRAAHGSLRPRYSADGTQVYFLGMAGGSVHLYALPLVGGEVREVVGGDRGLFAFSLTADGALFAAGTASHPNDLYFAPLDGSDERQLTDVNSDFSSAASVQPANEFWIEREDGTRVQGWYILPVGYEEGKRYPALLSIHGGPHTAYGHGYFHEFQILASRGYAVIYTNPRGSQGYGQGFADAIKDDWGGVDYDDLMACVDHVIDLGFVDKDRMGVGGGSYGGYMTAWIVGHTNRFKAAVASRLVSNLYSAWGNGDFTWMLWNWEMTGSPQERTDLYIERSPVQHARNVETPLLITHAEDDLRCNVEQAHQMYVALKTQRKEVKLVLFPSGGHEVSRAGKPSIRIARLQHIADWYDKYLKPSEC
jgi:dipeptidyl aminopeptidase/acylaminoacyl peptidase